MRRLLIAALLVTMTFMTTAHAAEEKDWGTIATLDGGMKIYGRYGSFERYDGAASMVVRFVNKGTISFYIAGISDKDCDAGYGQVTLFDTSWKLLKKEAYVAKGGNGISIMGDLLCLLINKQKGQNL